MKNDKINFEKIVTTCFDDCLTKMCHCQRKSKTSNDSVFMIPSLGGEKCCLCHLGSEAQFEKLRAHGGTMQLNLYSSLKR